MCAFRIRPAHTRNKLSKHHIGFPGHFPANTRMKHKDRLGKVHGILNASSKICSLVVNGQSFLVTDGSLLNLF